MEIPLLIGTLLVATGGISVACILYTIQGNLKPRINRVFFAMGAALSIWCAGSAILIAGESAAIAAVGTRLASIGYSMLFGALLHYVLLLVHRGRFPGRWWAIALLYLPGLISVTGLAVLPATGHFTETLIKTPAGWDDATKNPWVTFYYAYYTLYALACLVLLWRWCKKADEENLRRQSGVVFASVLAALALGSIMDWALSLCGVSYPSLGALFALIPVVGISYSVRRYGFMQPETTNPSEVILDHSARIGIFRVVGFCFFAGSLVNFLAQQVFYQETALPSVFLFSAILALAGLAALYLSRRALDEMFKELLFSVMFSLLIPLVTLRFSVYTGITVWAYFILLLMISLLFNKRILMASILVCAVETQMLTWSITPVARVTLDMADHIVRLALTALMAVISVKINRVYHRRLRANAAHAYRQRLVSEVSQSLVSVDEQNFDGKIRGILAQCGEYLRCERAYLALWSEDRREIERCCEWVAESAAPWHESCRAAMTSVAPSLQKICPGGAMFVTSDASRLPDEFRSLRERLLEERMRGFLLMPIVHGGEGIGFLAFATSAPDVDWDREPPSFLSLIANTVSDAVFKLKDIRRIEWTAYHDLLTELPNRQLFHKRLSEAIPRAEKDGAVFGIAFIDLDTFKAINDTMGHEAGDLLLKEIAAVITRHAGAGNTVARFGGDEFVLLLEKAEGEEGVAGIVRNVLGAIRRPVVIRGQEFFVTGSIGVSLYPHDGRDAETLMKNADIAMYEAKGSGKNQYALCSQPLKDRATENTQLTNLLYRAMEKEQLSVYYQPQIGLASGGIVGLEALLRWKLPDLGFISPAVFIPLAEQSGLIQSIGAWVLETACRQNRRWQEMGYPPVRVAVNISVQQMENRGFARQVALVLEKTGLPPEYLELEITESVANSTAANVEELMPRLKALGISISIDDFGTEYSSLERLKLLPIDRIKMDMQFVRGIGSSDKDKAIAQIIINLAKSLDMKVIAEGVETDTQLSFLSQRMCDEVQGFYYFKPMPADEVEAVFQECARRKESLRERLESALDEDGGRA